MLFPMHAHLDWTLEMEYDVGTSWLLITPEILVLPGVEYSGEFGDCAGS